MHTADVVKPQNERVTQGRIAPFVSFENLSGTEFFQFRRSFLMDGMNVSNLREIAWG